MIAAWAASIVAFLVCVTIYSRQYDNAYALTAPAAPRDPIAPVTLTAAAVVFVIIVVRGSSSLGLGARLASGVIGAIAAPMIFELPFDLIVMARTYPPVPPDPAFYRALFFVPLFLIEITTLLLLRLSPVARLTRPAFYSFALMLGVFAVWALSGFGYPSAPLPLALNIASKILAFVTALALFLPQRPAPGRRTPRRQARSSAPDGARPRHRLPAGAACGVLILALAATGCSSAAPHNGAPAAGPHETASPAWLCRPGQKADPCADNLAVTAVTADGALKPATWPSAAAPSKFDCFYAKAHAASYWNEYYRRQYWSLASYPATRFLVRLQKAGRDHADYGLCAHSVCRAEPMADFH
jgi:hypothetical protein